MRKKIAISIALVGLSSLGFAKTLAEVAGHKIDSTEVDAQAKLIVAASQGKVKDSPALRSEILRRLITREVVTREAQRLGLDKSQTYIKAVQESEKKFKQEGYTTKPGYEKDFADYKKVLLADTYAADFINKHPISENDVKKIYQKHVNFYKGSQEVKVGEILTRDTATANKAINELKRGYTFSQVAGKYTITPQLKSGIYPRYFNLKDMQLASPAYFNILQKLKKGQYTLQPIKTTDSKYVIVKLIDNRPATVPNFNQVKDRLKAGLLQIKLQQESQQLAKRYQVKVYP